MIHVMMYSDTVVGVFSSKEKLIEAFVEHTQPYHEEIISDMEEALKGNYRNQYDEEHLMGIIPKEKILEVLKLFRGEPYETIFNYKELRSCTDEDYRFKVLEIDTL